MAFGLDYGKIRDELVGHVTETASDHQTLHVRFREEHYKGIVNKHISDLLGTLILSY